MWANERWALVSKFCKLWTLLFRAEQRRKKLMTHTYHQIWWTLLTFWPNTPAKWCDSKVLRRYLIFRSRPIQNGYDCAPQNIPSHNDTIVFSGMRTHTDTNTNEEKTRTHVKGTGTTKQPKGGYHEICHAGARFCVERKGTLGRMTLFGLLRHYDRALWTIANMSRTAGGPSTRSLMVCWNTGTKWSILREAFALITTMRPMFIHGDLRLVAARFWLIHVITRLCHQRF